MKQLGELEQQRKNLLKAARTAIRLRYALMADEEINRRLPELDMRIMTALQRGELLEGPDVAELVRDA